MYKTEKELSEETNRVYGSMEDFLRRNPLKEVRGYAPNIKFIQESEIKILEQTLDSLDLSAVIKAINGI